MLGKPRQRVFEGFAREHHSIKYISLSARLAEGETEKGWLVTNPHHVTSLVRTIFVHRIKTAKKGGTMSQKIAIVYHSETGNTRAMADMVRQGCMEIKGVEVKCMPVADIDQAYIEQSKAIIFGSPVYAGTCSWQIKKYFDIDAKNIGGKIGGVFVSQNSPGGGGCFAEMVVIASMLVHGMLAYSGGANNKPYVHFGAVATESREKDHNKEFCLQLGRNIASKVVELFGT